MTIKDCNPKSELGDQLRQRNNRREQSTLGYVLNDMEDKEESKSILSNNSMC